MLILARKPGEAIAIANDIKIKVLEIKAGLVKLGVEAPGHITVHREEVYQRILEQNRLAAMEAPVDLTTLPPVFTRTSPTPGPEPASGTRQSEQDCSAE